MTLYMNPSSAVNRNPLEIFVGYLSYFCEEKDLFELFTQYATVVNVRLIRSDDKKRSLMYAFVLLSTRREVEEISGLMNNHLFMGRQLRLALTDFVLVHALLSLFQ